MGDESVPALLAALGATPRGSNFSIEEIASLVNIATQALAPVKQRVADDTEHEAIRALYDQASEEQQEVTGGSAGVAKVRKKDLMRIARRSLHIAKVLRVRD